MILGDARRMPELEDGSVHLVVTSPPYWQLKDYDHPGQIGYHETYEEYVASLHAVFAECARVLLPGCRICVNIGDQFLRGKFYGRYRVLPIRNDISRSLESLGLDPMGAIVWQKVTTCNTSGGATIMGSFPYPRNGILKIDYEHILIFKKPGRTPPPSGAAKERSKLTKEEWNRWFCGHWNFAGEKQSRHVAAFPVELPRRLIRMFTFEGESVLDPFLGSGTTTLAAEETGRSSIGYEINADFVPEIRERLGLFAGALEIVERKGGPAAAQKSVRMVVAPPRPADPPVLQADPSANGFGSVIRVMNGEGVRPQRRGIVVLSVDAVDTLVVDGGRKVRLAGIRAIPGDRHRGREFLRRLIGKSLVEVEPLAGGREAYVRLTNRTLLNGHLLKHGYAETDPRSEHRMRGRFERYEAEARDSQRGLWRIAAAASDA
jgi:site-specific DNA-methyltransferase (adenine-specific)